MDHQLATPEARYSTLVTELLEHPGVTHESGSARRSFGAGSLKVQHKIFAMLVKGRLVAKLPRQRVDALIAVGVGERFDPGHGRVMREWLAVDANDEADWLALAREALAFVSGQFARAQ